MRNDPRSISKAVFACAALSLGLSTAAWSAPSRGLALVFGGDGTENELSGGTMKSAANAARVAGFEPVIITDTLTDEQLAKAKIWIQPGGPNFEQAAHMIRTGIFPRVREFVAAGGGYVGFCGGAYMAQSGGGALGLNLLPGTATQEGGPTSKVAVNWLGKVHYVHYEYGPRFEVRPGIEVFATYAASGAPAAVRGRYGMGKVVLSGPHPEALPSWEPQIDPDGSDIPLAAAMIREAARP